MKPSYSSSGRPSQEEIYPFHPSSLGLCLSVCLSHVPRIEHARFCYARHGAEDNDHLQYTFTQLIPRRCMESTLTTPPALEISGCQPLGPFLLYLFGVGREQAERTEAHKKRLERYEMIGNQWAESGAGKRQHEKDIAEERRVLAEAAIKERADQDREIVC